MRILWIAVSEIVRASVAAKVAWWRELHRRWPLLVGVMRGKTIVFQAQLGPPQQHMLFLNNPNGSVVMDTSIDGGGLAAGQGLSYERGAGCRPDRGDAE